MRKRMTIMIIALVVVFGGVFGYKAYQARMIEQFLEERKQPPVTVAAVEIDSASWESQLKLTSELRAYQGVSVTTEAPGLVREIAFESGQTVSKGDLLVALDTETERAELEGLRADARLAEITLRRKRELRSRGMGSAAELDQAQAEHDRAVARVKTQEALIAEKTIRAPFDGLLGIRQVDLGQYVQPGTAVVSLQKLDPMFVDFDVPQKHVAAVRKGQKVSVRVGGYDENFQGEVTALNPDLSRNTRTFRVRARIENDDLRLRPGMYGNVALTVGEPRSFLTVRQTAVSYNPFGDALWVVTEDGEGDDKQLVAKRRTVKTGETRGDQVQILDGVEAGTRVIVAGHHKLQPGSRVVIDNDVLPANDPSPDNVRNY